MSNLQKITESEMEIMRIIWAHDEPITTAQIHKELPKDKKWAASTVLTFLSRLASKRIITSEKKGNANIFTQAITEKQYQAYETKSFLKSVHGGSPKSFVAALIEDDGISYEEIAELKKWLSEL